MVGSNLARIRVSAMSGCQSDRIISYPIRPIAGIGEIGPNTGSKLLQVETLTPKVAGDEPNI